MSQPTPTRFSTATRASRLTPSRVATTLASRLRKRTAAWARRRHGVDPDPFTIPTRRIYILPTRLGLFYSGMIFLLFLGSMNYANNIALGLTFMLAAIGLVAAHHCQRNLAGVSVGSSATDAVFAGQIAHFAIALESDMRLMRHDISVAAERFDSAPTRVTSGERAVVTVQIPTERRGRLLLDHVQVSSTFPFGLFRAWTHIHVPMHCIVYPHPAERGMPPPPTETDIGGAQESQRGDEDFAGLRNFNPGDSSRHIAWKAYARGQKLQVKQYAGTAVTSHLLEWDALHGLPVEARLSQLTRWIEDAHKAGRAFGLKIPGFDIPVNVGNSHRQHCLTILALFGLDHAHARAAS